VALPSRSSGKEACIVVLPLLEQEAVAYFGPFVVYCVFLCVFSSVRNCTTLVRSLKPVFVNEYLINE